MPSTDEHLSLTQDINCLHVPSELQERVKGLRQGLKTGKKLFLINNSESGPGLKILIALGVYDPAQLICIYISEDTQTNTDWGTVIFSPECKHFIAIESLTVVSRGDR